MKNGVKMEKFVANMKNKKPASPLLYGLFFEDINHGLDGGLNANLVQNGFFDCCYFNYNSVDLQKVFDNLRFWKCDPLKYFSVTKEKPLHENNPFSLCINLKEGDGEAIFKNLGYEIKNNENFLLLRSSSAQCSFFYSSNADFSLKCFFEYESGETSKPIELCLKASKKYRQVSFSIPCKDSTLAHLVFKASGIVTANFTGFRLVPSNYFRSKKNSYKFGKFNAALVESLRMGAKFLRFPGGCLVEGDVSTEHLYDWEKTIGPIETRVSKPSVWNYTQTNEIGFFEYLCLCEDLDLEPVPVHHVGLICQIRTEVFRHEGYIAFDPKSKEFKEKVIDSVAHLIFFAKGSVSSDNKVEREWAQKRKDMGHARPFKLNMIALGNENWDKIYFRNFEAVYEALKSYPYCKKPTNLLEKFGIQILSSAGVDNNPQDTNFSWKYITKHHDELIVDEHCYNTFQWFVDNFHRYDHYCPTTSKVFMGEYACHTDADGKGRLGGKNTFRSALAESVFQCGMENNPDIVKMSCYAPLFCKKQQANWDPDLLYFDGEKVFPTVNYVQQSLFMNSFGKQSIKLEHLNKNSSLAGHFCIKTNKNVLKSVLIDDKKESFQTGMFDFLETTSELENFSATLKFKEIKDDFSLGFGVKHHENFGFYLHYNFARKELSYEKIVDGFRISLEFLKKVELSNVLRVEFGQGWLKIFNEQNKLVAQKQIWKISTSIFTSLTYDEKNIYLKVINTSKDEKDAEFDLDKKLFFTKSKHVQGKMTTLTEHQYDEMSASKTVTALKFSSNKFVQTFAPESINVLTLKRK